MDDFNFNDDLFPSFDGGEYGDPPKGISKQIKKAGKASIKISAKVIKTLLPATDSLIDKISTGKDYIIESMEPTTKKLKALYKNRDLIKKDIDVKIKTTAKDIKSGKFFKSSDEFDFDGLTSSSDGFSKYFKDNDEDYSYSDNYSKSDDEIDQDEMDRLSSVGIINASKANAKLTVLSNVHMGNTISSSVLQSQKAVMQHQTELFKNQIKIDDERNKLNLKIISNINKNVINGVNQRNLAFKAQTEYSFKSLKILDEIRNMMKESRDMNFQMYENAKKSEKLSKNHRDNLSYGKGGVVDYLKAVKDNVMMSSVGSVLSLAPMMSMMFEGGGGGSFLGSLLGDSALGSAKQGLLGKDTRRSLNSLNSKISNAGPILNEFIKKQANKNSNSMLGSLLKTLVLDIDVKRSTDRFALTDPNAQHLFDNKTAQTINEVIPGYLSKIYSAISNSEETYYDRKTNTFKSKRGVLKRMGNQLSENIQYSEDYALVLSQIESGVLKNGKTSKVLKPNEIRKGLEKIYENIVLKGGPWFTIDGMLSRDESILNKMKQGLGSKGDMLVNEFILQVKNNPNLRSRLTASIMDSKTKASNIYAEFEEDMNNYGAASIFSDFVAQDDIKQQKERLKEYEPRIKAAHAKLMEAKSSGKTIDRTKAEFELRKLNERKRDILKNLQRYQGSINLEDGDDQTNFGSSNSYIEGIYGMLKRGIIVYNREQMPDSVIKYYNNLSKKEKDAKNLIKMRELESDDLEGTILSERRASLKRDLDYMLDPGGRFGIFSKLDKNGKFDKKIGKYIKKATDFVDNTIDEQLVSKKNINNQTNDYLNAAIKSYKNTSNKQQDSFIDDDIEKFDDIYSKNISSLNLNSVKGRDRYEQIKDKSPIELVKLQSSSLMELKNINDSLISLSGSPLEINSNQLSSLITLTTQISSNTERTNDILLNMSIMQSGGKPNGKNSSNTDINSKILNNESKNNKFINRLNVFKSKFKSKGVNYKQRMKQKVNISKFTSKLNIFKNVQNKVNEKFNDKSKKDKKNFSNLLSGTFGAMGNMASGILKTGKDFIGTTAIPAISSFGNTLLSGAKAGIKGGGKLLKSVVGIVPGFGKLFNKISQNKENKKSKINLFKKPTNKSEFSSFFSNTSDNIGNFFTNVKDNVGSGFQSLFGNKKRREGSAEDQKLDKEQKVKQNRENNRDRFFMKAEAFFDTISKNGGISLSKKSMKGFSKFNQNANGDGSLFDTIGNFFTGKGKTAGAVAAGGGILKNVLKASKIPMALAATNVVYGASKAFKNISGGKQNYGVREYSSTSNDMRNLQDVSFGGEFALEHTARARGIAKLGASPILSKFVKFLEGSIGKFLSSPTVQKILKGPVVGKIKSGFSKLISKMVAPKFITKISNIIASKTSQITARIATSAASGGLLMVGFFTAGMISGAATTRREFGIPRTAKPSFGMTISSSLSSALDQLAFGLLNPITNLIFKKSFTQFVYDIFGGELDGDGLSRLKRFNNDRSKILGIPYDSLLRYETANVFSDIGMTFSAWKKIGFKSKDIFNYWKNEKYKPLNSLFDDMAVSFGGKSEVMKIETDNIERQEAFRKAYIDQSLLFVKKNNLEWLGMSTTKEQFMEFKDGRKSKRKDVATIASVTKKNAPTDNSMKKVLEAGGMGGGYKDSINREISNVKNLSNTDRLMKADKNPMMKDSMRKISFVDKAKNIFSKTKAKIGNFIDHTKDFLQSKKKGFSVKEGSDVSGGIGLDRNKIPLNLQWDPRWKLYPYQYEDEQDRVKDRKWDLGWAGCGPTSMSMILSGVSGKRVYPEQISDWALANGLRNRGSGTNGEFYSQLMSALGINDAGPVDIGGMNLDDKKKQITDLLQSKMPVMLLGSDKSSDRRSLFLQGHYVVANKYDPKNDEISIMDPNSVKNSGVLPADYVLDRASVAFGRKGSSNATLKTDVMQQLFKQTDRTALMDNGEDPNNYDLGNVDKNGKPTKIRETSADKPTTKNPIAGLGGNDSKTTPINRTRPLNNPNKDNVNKSIVGNGRLIEIANNQLEETKRHNAIVESGLSAIISLVNSMISNNSNTQSANLQYNQLTDSLARGMR